MGDQCWRLCYVLIVGWKRIILLVIVIVLVKQVIHVNIYAAPCQRWQPTVPTIHDGDSGRVVALAGNPRWWRERALVTAVNCVNAGGRQYCEWKTKQTIRRCNVFSCRYFGQSFVALFVLDDGGSCHPQKCLIKRWVTTGKHMCSRPLPGRPHVCHRCNTALP